MNHYQVCLLAASHPEMPNHFIEWLRQNEHVWVAFCEEALRMVRLGHRHYSSKTIMEYLRHHSAISENVGEFKLNNNYTPYLSRLFAMAYPEHSGFFEFRSVGNAA